MSKHQPCIRIRLGQAAAGIEAANYALKIALGAADLLTEDERKSLHAANELMLSVGPALQLRSSL